MIEGWDILIRLSQEEFGRMTPYNKFVMGAALFFTVGLYTISYVVHKFKIRFPYKFLNQMFHYKGGDRWKRKA